MRIAVLLTGFLRSYKQSAPTILDQFKEHDFDIYCCTWDTQENGQPTLESDFDIYGDKLVKSLICSYKDYKNFHPNLVKINRDNDVFDIDPRAKEHGEYWMNRLRDQWYIVLNAFNMIDYPSKYDIIVRLRFDLALDQMTFVVNDKLTIPVDISGVWDYTDHMAYGNPSVMTKYCSLFNWIPNLYMKHNIDVTHAVKMPKYFMEEVELKKETFIDKHISYRLTGK